MELHFYKYQATGNDFILIDNRDNKRSFSVDQIEKICNRRFGVGADGLILIEKDLVQDFKIVYYNSDGTQSLCGNGCRSAIDLASRLGIVNGKATFTAFDGIHDATLKNGLIRVRMNDVTEVKVMGNDIFMNTGSPHHIQFVKNLKDFPVVEKGRAIRNSDVYKPGGTNVNFVELLDHNSVFVRTYERGVENETLSCGTGVTAVALAASLKGYTSPVEIQVMGGKLTVEFKLSPKSLPDNPPGLPSGQSFTDIFLSGPAKMVFEGDLEL